MLTVNRTAVSVVWNALSLAFILFVKLRHVTSAKILSTISTQCLYSSLDGSCQLNENAFAMSRPQYNYSYGAVTDLKTEAQRLLCKVNKDKASCDADGTHYCMWLGGECLTGVGDYVYDSLTGCPRSKVLSFAKCLRDTTSEGACRSSAPKVCGNYKVPKEWPVKSCVPRWFLRMTSQQQANFVSGYVSGSSTAWGCCEGSLFRFRRDPCYADHLHNEAACNQDAICSYANGACGYRRDVYFKTRYGLANFPAFNEAEQQCNSFKNNATKCLGTKLETKRSKLEEIAAWKAVNGPAACWQHLANP